MKVESVTALGPWIALLSSPAALVSPQRRRVRTDTHAPCKSQLTSPPCSSLKLLACWCFLPVWTSKLCLQLRRWNVLLPYCDLALYFAVYSRGCCSQTPPQPTLQWCNIVVLLFSAIYRWITILKMIYCSAIISSLCGLLVRTGFLLKQEV